MAKVDSIAKMDKVQRAREAEQSIFRILGKIVCCRGRGVRGLKRYCGHKYKKLKHCFRET